MEVELSSPGLQQVLGKDQAAATSSWSTNEGKKRRRSSTLDVNTNFHRRRAPSNFLHVSTESMSLAQRETQQSASVTYAPLDQETDQIRLVRLLPGCGSLQIECELHPTKIEDLLENPYEALSYTWGSPNKACHISLDGAEFTITTNLWSALSHLRSQDTTRTLWIDAICIDQANIQERNDQVKKMSMIYRRAKVVIVWLGEERDNSSAAFDFLKKVTEPVDDIATKSDPLAITPHSAIVWTALLALSSREYWGRVWIIQEVLCATKDVIQCGHDSISWSSFSKFREICAASRLMGSVALYHTEWEESPAVKIDMQRGTKASGRSLLQLLLASKSSLSTDPRDRVFALLGLAEDRFLLESAQDRLTIDYARSAFELYDHVVRLHSPKSRVQVCQLLHCLLEPQAMGQVEEGRKAIRDLPAIDVVGYFVGTVDTTTATASRGSGLQQQESKKPSTPLLDYSSTGPSASYIYDALSQLDDIRCARLTTAAILVSTQDGQAPDVYTHKCLPEIRQESERIFNTSGGQKDTLFDSGHLKLFNTKTGFVGIAPSFVEPGDVIYAFCGSNIVLVLSQRRCQQGSGIVGRAYATQPNEQADLFPLRTQNRLDFMLDERFVSQGQEYRDADAAVFRFSPISWEVLTR